MVTFSINCFNSFQKETDIIVQQNYHRRMKIRKTLRTRKPGNSSGVSWTKKIHRAENQRSERANRFGGINIFSRYKQLGFRGAITCKKYRFLGMFRPCSRFVSNLCSTQTFVSRILFRPGADICLKVDTKSEHLDPGAKQRQGKH